MSTFTDLVIDAHIAADIVSRELVGFIPAVARNSTADKAAVDQIIRVPIAPASVAADIVAGQLPPNTGAQTITHAQVIIDNFRAVPITWTGEEIASLNTGGQFTTVFGDQLTQAMRTITNEVENDLAGTYVSASIAADPAGTTLFDAANYKDLAAIRKLLNENGAPLTDRQFVMSNSAAEAYIGNAQNTGADTSGDTTMLNQGVIGNRFGMALRESAQVFDHTIGGATSATTNAAGYAVGETTLTLASAGTNAIVAGDVIVITGDATSTKYVVASGDADVSDGGTITLAAPGLKAALSAATHAITVQPETDRNMAFSRNALMLATRLPFSPPSGDSATGVATITDPRSGLVFELRQYGEYRQAHWEVAMAWGVEMIKPEHTVLLIA